MKPTPQKVARIGAGVLLVLALCLGGALACHSYLYPFGHRPCTLRCMHGALLAYADEHHGRFPISNNAPYGALRQLYPDYAPSGVELAGISGDATAVVTALRAGKPLTPPLTNWIYVPGLEAGDLAHLAILWESRAGLYPDGRRNSFGGRAVLLVGGDITNVPAADWEGFLRQQEQLRSAVQATRASRTNAPSRMAP